MAVYYPLSASLVLFTSILSNPRDQHTASDIQLMGLIISFITRSVQPGTSFAATPTLNGFKELYGIATRLVAKLPPHPGHKKKRAPESDGLAQPNLSSSSMTFDPATMYREPNMSVSNYPPMDASGHTPETDYDGHSTTSARRSQASTSDSPLEFAPFLAPEPSQFDFDFDQTMYDPFLSPTKFQWDMANMWDFVPDPGSWTDLVDSNQEFDIM